MTSSALILRVSQVLAFEEVSSVKTSPTSNTFTNFSLSHARAASQPLSSSSSTQPKSSSIKTTVQGKRPRAPSDPFLDTPAPSQAALSSSSIPSERISPGPIPISESAEEPPNPSPVSPHAGDQDELLATPRGHAIFDDTDAEYMRIWTSPDLPNPEFISLLKVFPTFITRRPLPRFPVSSDPRRPADIEEGEDDRDRGEGKEIRFGTGSMWVSSKERTDGYQGGWWTRFVLWWRRLFC